MTYVTKPIYAVKNLSILNALVLSHLQYPENLLQGLSQSLLTTLEKTLRWGCFSRQKLDPSKYLKNRHKIFLEMTFVD